MSDAIDLKALVGHPAVREMFTERSGAHKELGIEFVETDDRGASMRVPYRADLARSTGNLCLHAGAVMTALDSAMGMATMLALEEMSSLATLELRYDELRDPRPEQSVLVESHCESIDDEIAYLRGTASDLDGVFAHAVARFILTPAVEGSFFETVMAMLKDNQVVQ